MAIHIQHLAEQLEAARRDNDRNIAVSMIARFLIADDRPVGLSASARLMEAYWHSPDAGLALISSVPK